MKPSRRWSADLGAVCYDAIIIGSGLGGLTSAAILARQGKKVIILERHDVPGGFTHTFKRKGYEWDVGVHYVGQVGDPKSLLRQIFDYLTDQKLKWSPMGEIYDRVVIAGTTYDFVAGYENQVRELLRHFPLEEVAIRKYYALIKGSPLSSGLFFGERSMPGWLSFLVGPAMRWSFRRQARQTTDKVLRGLTANQQLRAVLCAQCGDYGLPPALSSFAVHASLVDHYLNGGNYPVGGARSIYELILGGIESRGGRLVLKAEVTEIVEKNGVATGVRLKNGALLSGQKVISNAGARNTFTRLWPSAVPVPPAVVKGLGSIQPSMSHICLYVGLKASDQELNLPKFNYWLYNSYDFDAELKSLKSAPSFDPALTYISFASAKDPEWATHHPGRATVQVIAPCPFAWVKQWEQTAWLKRGPEYLEFKSRWQAVLLEKLYSVVPQISSYVDYCEVSTPLSTAHFSNYQAGEIYGLEHTPERMLAPWIRAQTPLKNLFLTGQDLVMVGVGGAVFSGIITAVAVSQKNVMWPILRGGDK